MKSDKSDKPQIRLKSWFSIVSKLFCLFPKEQTDPKKHSKATFFLSSTT